MRQHEGGISALLGFSLVEMAVAMSIFAIIGMGLCNLVTANTQSQMNSRIESGCEQVASNIIERLRFDLRFASEADISADGSTITVTTTTTTANPVTYKFGGNTLIRQDNNGIQVNFKTAVVNDPQHPVSIFCQNQCFQPAGTVSATQVSLNNLIVRDASTQGSYLDDTMKNIVDAATGLNYSRAQFRVEAATFNVLNGQQFQ